MITSATTVYGQSAVNSTTNNKADEASFAAAFANASSTPAKTSSTASADKVSISAQAQQASAQDDIEVEAQALAKKTQDDPMWAKDPYVVMSWGDGEHLLPNNQKIMKQLQSELSSISGRPQTDVETKKYYELKQSVSTLVSFGDKLDMTDETTLKRQTEINKRYYEIMSQAVAKNTGKEYFDLTGLM
jgi:hypothetical protein